MRSFQHTSDIAAWLKPMGYLEFWYAVEPYNLDLQSRTDCDQKIYGREITADDMLDNLKNVAQLELAKHYQLNQKKMAS